MAPKRKSERALVSIVARYRSPLIFDYVNERCYDLSHGGMFIKSNNPVNPGTLLKLECLIDDGPDKIQGVARVVWVRRVDRPEGPRGMGVKFIKLEPGSEALIEKIIEKAGLPPKASESAEELPSQEPTETDRQATEPEEEREEESSESAEEESETQTAQESKNETQALTESAEAEREQNARQDQADVEHSENIPASLKSVAAATPSMPQEKAVVFPKWAMAVCAVALVGLVYVSLYDDNKNVKSAEQLDQKQSKEESQISSSKRVSNGTSFIDTAGQEESLASANRTSEPNPSADLNETPNEERLYSSVPPTDPLTTSNEPAQKDLKFVLKVTTSPPGARIIANDQSITSPGTLELGVVSSPIRVIARKTNFRSSRVVVERSIFVKKANMMEGHIHLDLEPKPEKKEEPQLEPPPKEPIGETERPDRNPSLPGSPSTSPSDALQAPETESPTSKDQNDSTADTDQLAETAGEARETDATQTPFKIATQCIAKGDNACAIETLKNKASTEAELGLLIETYRSVGDTSNATKYIKRFLEKFPKSNRSEIYRKIVEANP